MNRWPAVVLVLESEKPSQEAIAMTEQQLEVPWLALHDFLRPYLFCCGYTQTFAHLHTYGKDSSPTSRARPANPSPWPLAVLSAPCRSSSTTTSGLSPKSANHCHVLSPISCPPCPPTTSVRLTSSMRHPLSSRALRLPVCNARTSVVWARSPTASSPSISASARGATRR